MLQRVKLLCAGLTLLGVAGPAGAADIAAGKATSDKSCASCHEVADWKGQSEAQLQTLIKHVTTGKIKHKKEIVLSDADIANVAAYWASAAK
jgi:mono/diheme cytochrome c family protein